MTDTEKQKLFDSHIIALSGYYGVKLKEMKFSKPEIYEKDSVMSNSSSRKEAFITRHYIAGHHLGSFPTHSIVLRDSWYDRL